MANQNQRALPPDLARVRERLAAWRQTKQPGARIPESLWEMAVRLAGKYGVTRTARSLKLDYYALKKRVFLAEGQPAENGSAFVELPSVSAPASACVIEWEDHAGIFDETTQEVFTVESRATSIDRHRREQKDCRTLSPVAN